ncbi:TIGR04282 family arsenosugar biosynthesis glycosyltransferase [Pseudoruegeria sp. SHC-113]|uniref:TIGR04282 family arsenosugar biosynthesis glycosyltransferase n=1 Tax=Pseudoruegeria sp. SHC-113 TaxID=2855439 RepID=UPI0021BAF9AC|nr:TIGR04282 family arsenosugar biosynthesis glycosyltransferase [Pseudoruegeria sp. SHC-113]MCT8158777.1 TIGR04282 family arsenosugar biosynthesis glycosyltransferase [Pseudoruegeria sp. SHC-113]
MVKEPRPGRVKTRLGRDLGMVSAAWWFRHQTARLLRRLADPRWDLILAVAPDVEGMQSRVWPEALPRVPQGAGDLGNRMGRIFRSLPPGPVVIIGGDIPGITPAHIARAFKALGRAEAVLGPAPDGGYWLIGLKRTFAVQQSLFSGVRWSSEHAMADTVASLGTPHVAYIDTLQDVDTLADLKRISA